tara:strand:+ start:686 stop:1684 length:999 start_codon:yes stop_codon:yes gene_type:complete
MNLRQLVYERSITDRMEHNLEQGELWVYTNGNVLANWRSQHNGDGSICWKSPGDGTAVIEIWGSGGSQGRMCCCGVGLPGNSGAYSKKSITVNSSSYIYAKPAISLKSETLCFAGCGDATCLCWIGSTGNGCMCAQGGLGGNAICQTSTTSSYCCYVALGFCNDRFGLSDFCGRICNLSSSRSWEANAYGGDINCPGNISQAIFYCCGGGTLNTRCKTYYFTAPPPGMYADGGGGGMMYTGMDDARNSPLPGMMMNQAGGSYGMMSHSPSRGIPRSACWRSLRQCSCYEHNYSCVPYTPPAWGAPGSMMCANIRDSGGRGGMGVVRIRFIES